MICSICFNDIPVVNGWTIGNNAEPVNMGRCCHDCDNNVVIPARMTMMSRNIRNEYLEMQQEQFEALREIFEPKTKEAQNAHDD